MIKNGLIIDDSGNKHYYVDGFLHRENGPAVEYFSGTKFWMQNNALHRLDGPAAMYHNNDFGYYYKGIYIKTSSLEEFTKIVKLMIIK